MISYIGTNTAFVKDIEEIVWMKDVSYIEAVLLYCESKKIEVESVVSMIKNDPVLQGKLELEAQDLRFLPRSARLPI